MRLTESARSHKSFCLTGEPADAFLARLGDWSIDELADVVDDVAANENETTEVPAIDASNRNRRTVELILWQVLQRDAGIITKNSSLYEWPHIILWLIVILNW